jgi:hypothetical protein
MHMPRAGASGLDALLGKEIKCLFSVECEVFEPGGYECAGDFGLFLSSAF